MSYYTYDDDSYPNPETTVGKVALVIGYLSPFILIAAILIWLFW